MAEDRPRLIEVAFPLKQSSLDSVHEKNVRHGHISTLHIWPARRPLAACRAALIATLLPDPGTEVERKRLLELLGGHVVTRNTTKRAGGRTIPVIKEETEGGILHWGRENGPAMDFFREEIKKAYGGRAPRVLDPFAGGGAIPLEAMRLGCEVTAMDINPVAWFILKCTLEYPQRLAGQTRPLPRFALESPEFMAAYWKARGNGRKGRGKKEEGTQPSMLEVPEADLSWHVRAWGHWVLERARRDLERFYPTVDCKPTVAYLWARTVTCKNCRATVPLLKTLWLCRKENKRWRLAIRPRADRTGVDYEVTSEPVRGGNAGQRRAYDQEVGGGTMSRSGARCPVCSKPGTVSMTMEDIRAEGMAGRLGAQMTAVVVDGPHGKEYRLPTQEEIHVAEGAANHVEAVFRDVPFGLPTEPLPTKEALGFRVPLYGFDQWYKLFTPRQLVALGTFVKHTRAARDAMRYEGYTPEWLEAVSGYLACVFSRTVDYLGTLCVWETQAEEVKHTFMRWALPITWDFAEANPLCPIERFYVGGLNSAFLVLTGLLESYVDTAVMPKILKESAICTRDDGFDLVFTDPPYYDAIPYSDLMDFFYVWLRRTCFNMSSTFNQAFNEASGPKWDTEAQDGELIDDQSRHHGDRSLSIKAYEYGMHRAFVSANRSLNDNGHMVVVFANKNPAAWESLVGSAIRAGFSITGSWPIVTEMPGGLRNLGRASLASSIWLVCRKRPEAARPGWDTQVLEEMRSNIYEKLRQFWDAGIRGPDFVWSATGPALEAYSKHPAVKKADEPDRLMTVSEFLRQVRRIVVDYVVGRVLSRNGEGQTAEGLDDLTVYYLLHRHDFGLAEAPVGASILYAQSCSLQDRDLADRFDLLAYGKGKAAAEEEDGDEESAEGEEEEAATSGSTVKLKRWDQRLRKDLGLDAAGRRAPLIDQAHRMMRLWRAGEVQVVDACIEDQGLRRNPVFPRLLQAMVELAGKEGQHDERALLESIMNHVSGRGAHPQMRLLG